MLNLYKLFLLSRRSASKKTYFTRLYCLLKQVNADEERVILTFDRDYGELIYRWRLRSPRGVIYSVFLVYEVGTRGPVPFPYGGDRAICGILHKPGIRCMISEKASDVILASAKNQKILPVYESK